MDKELINQRLLELEKLKLEAYANLNAVVGAIQDCQYWLNVLEKSPQGEQLSSDPASRSKNLRS